MSDIKREIVERLMWSFDEEPEEQDAVDAIVSGLKIDIHAFAQSLDEQIKAYDAKKRSVLWQEDEERRKDELLRLERRELPATASLEELNAELSRLLARTGTHAPAGLHMMKFERATEADLREAIRSLQHLLDGSDDE